VEKTPLSHWQEVGDVNLTGVFLCGREAAYHMVEKATKGVIVSISSVCRRATSARRTTPPPRPAWPP
jgi:3-oxoacyl-[acyl-carrier protein] reductase